MQHQANHIRIKVDVTTPHLDIKDKTLDLQKAVEGKKFSEIPEYLSRLDSSLSFAHTLAYLSALENLFSIRITKKTSVLRQVMLNAEIISSHTSHILTRLMPRLHKINSAYDLISSDKKEFRRTIQIIKKTEAIGDIIAKRLPHPINAVIGGFMKDVSEDEKKLMIDLFKEMLPDIIKLAETVSKWQQVQLAAEASLISLWELDQMPYLTGKIAGRAEQPMSAEEYIGAYTGKDSIVVGPISRLNNNSKLLSTSAERLCKKFNLKFPQENLATNFLCMAIESVHCTERCIELLSGTHFDMETPPDYEIKEGKGASAVESAKGLICHEYTIDAKGVIKKARIISNISQNMQSLHKQANNLPFDPDKKTRKQIIDEISNIIDAYYL